MGLRRDPLDELIGDLETALPSSPLETLPSYEDTIFVCGTVLHGSEEAKRRLKTDPRYLQFISRMRAIARRSESVVQDSGTEIKASSERDSEE
jgi:hypothetical protein